MKKENRKAAQQRRAEERAKLAKQKKRKKILSWILPILAVILLFLLVIFGENLFSSKGASSDTSSDPTAESTSEQTSGDSSASDSSSDDADTSASSDDTDYSTDTSLTIKDGDVVNIDYTGTIDGTEFAGGSTNGSGATLTIGSGTYIDDFEEQLIGHHPGDVVDVNVTFPEDYHQADLQGKDALFKVTVNGIYTS